MQLLAAWIAAVLTAAMGPRWQPVEIGMAATQPANAAIEDQVTWRWDGQLSTAADFGDPQASTAYTLCVYDQAATSALHRHPMRLRRPARDGAPY